jgi:hypothetical protein
MSTLASTELPADDGSGHIEGVLESELLQGETLLTLHRWPDSIGLSVKHERAGQGVSTSARLTIEQAEQLRDELDAAIEQQRE